MFPSRVAALLLATGLAQITLAANDPTPINSATPAALDPVVLPEDGQLLVRVAPRTHAQLAAIDRIATQIWSERVGLGPIEVQVGPGGVGALRELGLQPVVLIPDLGTIVRQERAELTKVFEQEAGRFTPDRAQRNIGSPHDLSFWEAFRPRDQIETYLNGLVAAYPDHATLQQIGTSVEGTPIWAVLISAPDSVQNPRDQRQVVQFNGTQHAREWISPMTVLYLADRLLAEAETSPRVAGLLDTVEFAIVPITNPDGYDYSWTSQRFWRKNRRNNGNGTVGVDLNRNWDFQWGGSGSSGNTDSSTYRGPSPFSEPETQAVSDLALSFGDRFAGGIDYHSYSQLILWPWGYATAAQLPEPDRTIITDLSIAMAGSIAATSGASYSPEKATDLYPADGTADDWYQGGTPGYGLTIELRTMTVFDPEREHVFACAIENFPAALQFAEGVTQGLRIAPTTPWPVAAQAGTPINLEARFSNALGTLSSATPTLHVTLPGEATETAIPMTSTGSSVYAAALTLPDVRGQARVRVTAETTDGALVAYPATGTVAITTLGSAAETVFADTFETDLGWTTDANDDATTGAWVRGVPNGSSNHPGVDGPDLGTQSYITGLGASNDVDNGKTTLISPAIAVPARPGDLIMSADLWRLPRNTEPMQIEVAADESGDWTLVDTHWPAAASWDRVNYRVNDFIAPTSSFRLRFIAADLPGGDVVEMAVDDVRVVLAPEPSTADLNGDGVVDNGDIGAFVALFLAGDLAVDFTGDGVTDNGDIGAFIIVFLQG